MIGHLTKPAHDPDETGWSLVSMVNTTCLKALDKTLRACIRDASQAERAARCGMIADRMLLVAWDMRLVVEGERRA